MKIDVAIEIKSKFSYALFMFLVVVLLAPLAHAVRVDIPDQDYNSQPNSLQPKQLSQRYDALLKVVSDSTFYIPDSWTLSHAEICYNMMAASRDYHVRKVIYKACFYNEKSLDGTVSHFDSDDVDGENRGYLYLIAEQLITALGGPDSMRSYSEVIAFATTLYEHFFTTHAAEKTGASFDFVEMFNTWHERHLVQAHKLAPAQIEQVFTQAFLNFTQQMQESRKHRKSIDELKPILANDIREYWPEEIKFEDFRKAKEAGDIIGFAVLKQDGEACSALLR